MLINFTVNNFLSIKDTAELSLQADKKDSRNCFPVRKYSILTSAVIYGANASGKSNVLKAMAFMRSLVLNKSKVFQSTDLLPHRPHKLSGETVGASSTFEVTFFYHNTKYRYGFENDESRVYAEWLFADEKGQEAKLFVREQEQDFLYVNPEKFKEGRRVKVLPNSLFLWRCDQEGGQISRIVLEWFKGMNFLDGMRPSEYLLYSIYQLENEGFRKILMKNVSQADLGIHDLVVEKNEVSVDEIQTLNLPESLKTAVKDSESPLRQIGLRAQRRFFNQDGSEGGIADFDFSLEESEGTRKFFCLSAPVIDTLQKGQILIIDELDASLHPMLTLALLDMFHDPEINKNNAQLIFASHDTNLLNQAVFNRSQIWFTEKDSCGGTHLIPLLEYKNVRKTDNLEKHYIQGKFGAIPYIGKLSWG